MLGIIVSESSIVAKAIIGIVEPSFVSVEHCARLTDVRRVPSDQPFILIYDLSRPADEVDLLHRFIDQYPSCRTLVLTKETHDLGELEPMIGRVGAILPPSIELGEIALVAKLVLTDLFLLPSTMIPSLQKPRIPTAIPRTAALTEREASVLALIAEGASNKVIARRLGINDTTVRVHVRSVLRKIGVHNRTQAALLVVQNQGTQ